MFQSRRGIVDFGTTCRSALGPHHRKRRPLPLPLPLVRYSLGAAHMAAFQVSDISISSDIS
eukprot:3382608-Pleurochrysis_carterae.AAC.1